MTSLNQAWETDLSAFGQISPPTNGDGFFNIDDDAAYINAAYGKDFIQWYHGELVTHGKSMLNLAIQAFDQAFDDIPLGIKIPGVHWTAGGYDPPNAANNMPRSAEVCAGIIGADFKPNIQQNGCAPGYSQSMQMLSDLKKSSGLNHSGFPTQLTWYDDPGEFTLRCDPQYDEQLYLQRQITCYVQNPDAQLDAHKVFEQTNFWNTDGILTALTRVEYGQNGQTTRAFKWRGASAGNAARGTGGIGFDEYYREYDQGRLVYQEEMDFDGTGIPIRFRVDDYGNGIFEHVYTATIETDDAGRLTSVIWLDCNSLPKWQSKFAYGADGLPAMAGDYAWNGSAFALHRTINSRWYANPVNGPSGGLKISFESDQDGNPISDYESIAWAASLRIRHFYKSPDQKICKISEMLETVNLPE